MASPRPSRPRISLPPPMIPMTPGTGVPPLYRLPSAASTLGVATVPSTALPDGPWAQGPFRTGFVIKQIRGVKDFTVNFGKSGLSVGEKTAFWLYNKVSHWSQQWFTHFFLFLVVFGYSLLGASIFVAVERPHEVKVKLDFFKAKESLLQDLRSLSNNISKLDEDRWHLEATKRLVLYQDFLYQKFKDKGQEDDPRDVWDFWNAVFYCGTIYTTIGATQPVSLGPPCSSLAAAATRRNMADEQGSLRGIKGELSPAEPQGRAPLATFEAELNVRLREPDEVLVRPAVRRRTSKSRDRAVSKEARRRKRLAEIQQLEQEEEEAAAAAAAAAPPDDLIKEEKEEEEEEEEAKQKDEERGDDEEEEEKPGFFDSYFELIFEARHSWPDFKAEHAEELQLLRIEANRCFCSFVLLFLFCGFGGFVFRFTESTFEQFYKCGVKRVKRDFIEGLWVKSQQMREEEWKSMARRKLWEFEDQLQAAFDAGINTYSGQRSWSFLNAVVYCITVVTTIGYGHITPSTNTGRAVTIIYAIFGIPLFLILLADFGKMFTRAMKFLWAFVRRLYYTGSCRKVRHTGPVQEVMKGVQMVYDIARFQKKPGETNGTSGAGVNIDPEEAGAQLQELLTVPGVGQEPPTPAPSNFDIDDEFNLPISVAFVILVIYILVGATLYCMWEDWSFFEAFYFVFISMSTIGFGDYVPKHPMFMMGSIVYLIFGLALTSMCINVVQVKLSDSFRQASSKIGASFGMRLAAAAAEEEAARNTPGQVELAEVHHVTAKKASEENLDGLSMETP